MLLKTIIIWVNSSRWSKLFFLCTINLQNCAEFQDIAGIFEEVAKQFASLKLLQFLASWDQALRAITTNFKTLYNHLKNISNFESRNKSTKVEGPGKKTKSHEFLAYLYFVLEFIPLFKNFLLFFKRTSYCVVILLRTWKVRKR